MCFFCEIQEKEDPLRMIESENFYSRYDGYPVSEGHALVVPKKHVESFFDLDPKLAAEMHELVKITAGIVKARYKPDGFNIGVNEGRAAGRSIDHLHVHIIPRYEGDKEEVRGGIRQIFPDKADYSYTEK